MDKYAPEADLNIDLSKFPWPWASESIYAVSMFHFLEHVDNLQRTILEVHRILIPDGTWRVVVPHARNSCAYDVDHRHRFTAATFRSIAGRTWYHHAGRGQLFHTLRFSMPLVQFGLIRWTPLDSIVSRWPIAYEKVCPIAPAVIDWTGLKVQPNVAGEPQPPSGTHKP